MKWQPTRCYAKCLGLTKRIRSVYGGSSAGKTVAILPILYKNAVEKPGLVTTVISDTLANLKKGAIRDFKNILLSTNAWDPECWAKSESIYTLRNGSIIEFVGAEDETKLRGPRRDVAYINEANRIKYEVFDQINMRTKGDLWLDWNPSGKFWWNQYMEDVVDMDVLVVNYEDNDWVYTEEGASTLEMFKQMKEQSTLSEFHMNKWKVYGLGEWGALEGACIKSYEVIDHIPDGFYLQGIGLDFGTVDPNAAVALYKNDANEFLFDEILYKNQTKYQGDHMYEGIARDIRAYSRDVMIYADYAWPMAIGILKRLGLRVRKCKKGPDSIKAGIDLINDNKIYVTEKSKNLLEEFALYRYKLDKDGNLMEGKYEGPDHLVDACRYVLGKSIKKRQARWISHEPKEFSQWQSLV